MNCARQTRRAFLRGMGGAGLSLFLGRPTRAHPEQPLRVLRFGLCADVHKDIMHDADVRLKAFVERSTQARVDFALQLGDFCTPQEQNRGFLAVWKTFAG